jgi:hypothetical protein
MPENVKMPILRMSSDLRNRVDPEATAMSTPAYPQEVLNAIKEIHEETKANAPGTRL